MTVLDGSTQSVAELIDLIREALNCYDDCEISVDAVRRQLGVSLADEPGRRRRQGTTFTIRVIVTRGSLTSTIPLRSPRSQTQRSSVASSLL